MTDLSDLHREAVTEFTQDVAKRKADLLRMREILDERNDDLQYGWDHRDMYGPAWPSCGCRPKHSCEYHSYIEEELGE